MRDLMTTTVAVRRALALAVAVGTIGPACLPSLVENPPRDARAVLPDRFDASLAPAEASTDENLGTMDWRGYFASPDLQALIDEALRHNQELDIQLQELVIGRAEVDARFGEMLPKLGAGVGAGIEKVGGETSQGAADRLTGVPEHLPDFRFGLHGSWEVDIWGKLRDATAAADTRYRASVEARNFIITQLVAEIARSYYELVALDGQVEVLTRNIAIQRDALAVVRLQKDAARVTELAVQRFEAEVLKNRSRLFALQQLRGVTENRINFLVGRRPQPIPRSTDALRGALPTMLHAGVPTDLLKNRPDIRRAELQLEAAKLDVNVARASFLPALSIDAELGYNAFNPLHLLSTPEALVYNLAGNLVAPILNRPAIEAQYRTANAAQIQAVISYERTMLQAFIDVENALIVFQNLRQGFEFGAQQVATLDRAVETSNVLFQSARADYMEVLLTRRDVLDAELELIELRKSLWHSTVDLYQALGGGWRTGDAATGTTTPLAAPTKSPSPAATTSTSTPPAGATPAPATVPADGEAGAEASPRPAASATTEDATAPPTP